LEKPTFHPLGDFFKACPSRAKAGFKKIAKFGVNILERIMLSLISV
jgi:hypothetical protein